LVEHEMKVWLPKQHGAACGFWFTRDRGSRDFDDRAASVMTTLRPHLAFVFDRWQQRRRCPDGITTREAEILALLRDGHGNREIAARLVISPHTVRTHLEHIFEKLDVHTRTAAVRRAYGEPGPPE
jgi:ATP/maltotriose-dependent transcriptional regulator MalT